MQQPTHDHQDYRAYPRTYERQPLAEAPHEATETAGHSQGHGMHKWMMLLMCIPLVAIGLWTVINGGGFGGLVSGLLCMGMMMAMHLFMGGQGKHSGH